MNPWAIIAFAWLLAILILASAALAIRKLRHPPQRGWDWPEDEHPSPGGWADRERL